MSKINLETQVVDLTSETLTLFPQSGEKSKKSAMPALMVNADREAVALWDKCSEIIRDNVDKQAFRTWFEPIKAFSWADNKLTVIVPSQWFFEWIETHYYSLLQRTIAKVLGENAQLHYQVVVDDSKDNLGSLSIKVPGLKYPPAQLDNGKMERPFQSNLNPRYVFDNFITGDSNQLACSAAMAVAQNPGGTRFNPLFIYGGTGLGKTHLAQAIGNYIVRKKPSAKVLYTNSEKFYIDYITAVQANKINDFANFYRSADVLIIDDIQFLAGKEKTQDHFFHTFNSFHQAGKQLILTSDKPPKDLAGIEDRLISRFQWGLTADVQQPDYEMRVAILNKKSADEGIELPNDVLEFIARNLNTNIRELEGALIKLIAKTTFDDKPLTLELAKEVLMGEISSEPQPLDIDEIKNVVSAHMNIGIDLMESKSRKHEIALARQMAMYLTKQLTELSLKSIGSHFGGRDHSTVLHSCQAIDNYIVTDRTVKASYEFLLNKLKNR